MTITKDSQEKQMVQIHALKSEKSLPVPVIQNSAQETAFKLGSEGWIEFHKTVIHGDRGRGNEIKNGLEDAFGKW